MFATPHAHIQSLQKMFDRPEGEVELEPLAVEVKEEKHEKAEKR
jgi:hypothetical protein